MRPWRLTRTVSASLKSPSEGRRDEPLTSPPVLPLDTFCEVGYNMGMRVRFEKPTRQISPQMWEAARPPVRTRYALAIWGAFLFW